MTKKRSNAPSVPDETGNSVNDAGGAPRTRKPPKRRKPDAPAATASVQAEPVPATQVETTTLPIEVEEIMEVHHHPDIGHKPKHFKEYLLEGFMIFIAVMMGFIAENIREAISNREHVQQLTSQLIIDLKVDIAQLNEADSGETQIVKNNDTLFNILSQPLKTVDLKKVQLLAAGSHSLWLFHQSTGAINAIKNELHLEQFSNSKIISYVSAYERHVELLHLTQDIALQYQRGMLEPFLQAHFTPENLYASFNKGKGLTAETRNLTQSDLAQFRTDLVLIRINSNELVSKNRSAKADAENLMKYVMAQFHPDTTE